MDGYKHFIRTQRIGNEDIIIHRFSDAFEQPQESDICVNDNGGRHYNDPVTNERGQYNRQWINGIEFSRSKEDLDAEWAARPAPPKTDKELLTEARQELGRLNRTIDSLSYDVQAIIDTIVV